MSFALVAALFSLSPVAERACGWGEEQPRLSAPAEQGGLLRGQAPPEVRRITIADREVPLSSDGRFIVGIDRDAERVLSVDYWNACGERLAARLSVAPREWRIQHVNVARNLPREGDESWNRREAEVLRTAAARERRTSSQGWRQEFIWPARGRISGRFGSQRIYRGEPGSYHGGVDVAAATGTPIVAPADGVVVLAEPGFSLEGNLVIVDHGSGLSSSFLHLSRIDVREGQAIRQGERIGAVGATGRATGPHLHWALTWNGAKLDPERVAGPMN